MAQSTSNRSPAIGSTSTKARPGNSCLRYFYKLSAILPSNESTLLGRSPASSLTYREFGLSKLHSLLEGLGLGGQVEKASQLFDLLTESYSFFPLGGAPLWPSDITDDGTPFEFSVAFCGGEATDQMFVSARSYICCLLRPLAWHLRGFLCSEGGVGTFSR